MMFSFSKDLDHVNEILVALQKNDGYCPCRVEKIPENKCMCKEFREQESGYCHCGLYYKEPPKKEEN